MNRRMKLPGPLFVAALVAALASSCSDRNVAAVELVYQGENRQVVDVGRQALDLLFVIDNSRSMEDEQTALAANFDRFIAILENTDGGLPDLHLGVISTDVGTGRSDVGGCDGEGDDGRLQATPRGACSAPDGSFLRSFGNDDGSRTTNFEGELGDAFACIARLGTGGCGFEQPLESMRRALAPDNVANAGFLRDDALLAVVFITDEDDCSARDPALFDAGEPIGPFDDFRCFAQGVICRGDEPRSPGPKAECTARADSAYLESVERYSDFLVQLKGDIGKIVVAGIAGDLQPVAVSTDGGSADLEPSCSSAVGVADPPVRLAAFFDRFPGRSRRDTICTADPSAALMQIADLIGSSIPRRCLPDNLADVAPEQPGLQVDCAVSDVFEDGTEVLLPECGDGIEPCFQIVTGDDACGVRLDVVPEQRNLPLGTRTEARCAVVSASGN